MIRRMSILGQKLFTYDAVGFDLDHTLAKYKVNNLLKLVGDTLVKHLVDQRGHDKSLLEMDVFSRHNFVQKGLVYDIQQGHIISLKGPQATVHHGYHGGSPLTEDKLHASYPTHMRPSYAKNLALNYRNGLDHRVFDNYFDLPCVPILDECVRRSASGEDKEKSPQDIWNDMFSALLDMYDQAKFGILTGGYYDTVVKNPGQYLELIKPEVVSLLKQLKDEGKMLFLITASHTDYAEFILNFIFSGSSWRDLFDLVVYAAQKPKFFQDDISFRLSIDGSADPGDEVKDVERGQRYCRGSYARLDAFLSRELDKTRPSVAYFGDSVKADIVPAGNHTKWEVWGVIEELNIFHTPVLSLVEDEDNEHVPSKKRRIEDDGDENTLNNWGSCFHCEDGSDTLWYSVIKKHCTAAVSELADLT